MLFKHMNYLTGRHVQHEYRFYRMSFYAGRHVLLEDVVVMVMSFMRIFVMGGHI